MPLPQKLPQSSSKQQKKRILANRYQIEKKLGSGNYGVAWLVTDLKATSAKEKQKVLKEIQVGDLLPDETLDTVREANLLRSLDHPSIVKFYDSFVDQECFCLVTEYCEGGDLDCKLLKLKKENRSLHEAQIVEWLLELLLAVQFMHNRRVLHRDLKARNIFLKNGRIKIGDFGISRILMTTTDVASTFIGTPYYMSPEVLKHEGYNSKSDVWSIGCILYEMATLNHAFSGNSLMGVMYRIVEGDLPEWPSNYSSELGKVYKQLLTKDPELRPSAAEVLKQPFIATQIKTLKNTMLLISQGDSNKDAIKKASLLVAAAVNNPSCLQDLQKESNEKFLKNMTPRERSRLRKIKEADERARQLADAARKKKKVPTATLR